MNNVVEKLRSLGFIVHLGDDIIISLWHEDGIQCTIDLDVVKNCVDDESKVQIILAHYIRSMMICSAIRNAIYFKPSMN